MKQKQQTQQTVVLKNKDCSCSTVSVSYIFGGEIWKLYYLSNLRSVFYPNVLAFVFYTRKCMSSSLAAGGSTERLLLGNHNETKRTPNSTFFVELHKGKIKVASGVFWKMMMKAFTCASDHRSTHFVKACLDSSCLRCWESTFFSRDRRIQALALPTSVFISDMLCMCLRRNSEGT